MINQIPEMTAELFAMADTFEEEVKVLLPVSIGEEAEKIFAGNILKQGISEPFKPLSDSRIQQRGGSTEPILIWTGEGLEDVSNSAREPIVSEESIIIPFETEINREGHYFMQYHNEGVGNNPQRQFAADSPELEEMIEEKIEETFNKLTAI